MAPTTGFWVYLPTGWVAPSLPTISANFISAAPVKGLQYVAWPSGLSGTTDANGTYTFKAGDAVTFTIPNGNSSSSAIKIATLTPPGSSLNGGNVITFTGSFSRGAGLFLQILNHSTNPSMMDVSGVSLDSANAANLNTYMSSNGYFLSGGLAVTGSSLQNALTTAQSAVTYSGGGTASTPVTSTYYPTVYNSFASGIAALPTPTSSLNIPVSGVLNILRVFSDGTLNNYIEYHNPNGTISYFQPGSPDPSNMFVYPNITWAVPTTPINSMTITWASNTVAGTTYPGYVATLKFLYADNDGTLGTFTMATQSAPSTVVGSGSIATINLDPAFSLSFVAGKTFNFGFDGFGLCANAQLTNVYSSDGKSATSYCAGSITSVATWSISAVSGVPGVLAATSSLGGPPVYFALIKGSTPTIGRAIFLHAATTSTSNDGKQGVVPYTSQ